MQIHPGSIISYQETEVPAKAVGEVARLLEAAAKASVEAGLDLEAFMTAAWAAVMKARPELREHLEHAELVAGIERLRETGKLGQA
jgi:hypothetical protein